MKYKDYITQRKESIPEIAFRMFAERGIETVTMQDIADATDCGIASLYRYHGTKLRLVIDIAALKWREYAEFVTAEYNRQNGADMNGYEEFEFMLSRYIDLYQNHKELVKFDFGFALYVQHEKQQRRTWYPTMKVQAFLRKSLRC